MKPMKKIFTFLYSMNSLSNPQNDLVDLDTLLDENLNGEFNDVLDILDKAEIAPDDKIVKNILSFAKNFDE